MWWVTSHSKIIANVGLWKLKASVNTFLKDNQQSKAFLGNIRHYSSLGNQYQWKDIGWWTYSATCPKLMTKFLKPLSLYLESSQDCQVQSVVGFKWDNESCTTCNSPTVSWKHKSVQPLGRLISPCKTGKTNSEL
jgi:hypothetical protein